MKFISIKSLASRGWFAVFVSVLLCLLSIALIANAIQFGKGLIAAALMILPFGLYDIFLGRVKFKGISLNEYKLTTEKEQTWRVQVILVITGSILNGLVARYIA